MAAMAEDRDRLLGWSVEDHLAFDIGFALPRAPVRGLRPWPTEEHRRTIASLPTFRDAYARRRCIVPIDGFFEWKAIKGQRARQPFAIAMKDGSPFGIAGLWENWKGSNGEWVRTFTIITVPANELVGTIH